MADMTRYEKIIKRFNELVQKGLAKPRGNQLARKVEVNYYGTKYKDK